MAASRVVFPLLPVSQLTCVIRVSDRFFGTDEPLVERR